MPFAAYLALMCAAGVGLITAAAGRPATLEHDLLPWAAFIGLFVLAEYAVLSFHRSDARVGLSLSEAIVLAMLTGLQWEQVVIGLAIGSSVSAVAHRGLGGIKNIFNVASLTVAGSVAALTAAAIGSLAPGLLVMQLSAAAVATALYAAVTHLNVAIAVSLSSREPFLPLLRDVPRATVLNVAAGIVLGLLLAAAYTATPWSLMLFPFALLGIGLGYRALVEQDQERHRVKSLHDASRVLAASPDLVEGLARFLASAAQATSSLGSMAVLDTEDGPIRTAVYADEVTADREPVDREGLARLLAHLRKDPRPIMDGSDLPGALTSLREELSARSFLAVPLIEREAVVGYVMVTDRVGATDFGEHDARLLEALANDLSLTLGSRRLFDEVVQQRERFQLLVESVNDYAIFMVDPQGVVVSWNAGAERIQGYSAEEIIGKHFSLFYSKDEESTQWMQELSVAATEGRQEVEGWRVRRDGSKFLANEVVSPIRDQSGELRGFAKVTRDVTERVTAQREKEALEYQLHQVQKLESVGQLAGGVAHDFNNILSVIMNSATFVLDELEEWKLTEDQAIVVDDVKEIRDAADRAAALTRQLLMFSRRDVIEPVVLNLNDVIKSLTKLMQRAVGENVEIAFDLADVIGTVKADPGQIEQVLLNLVINARDAMEEGGTITVSTRDVALEGSHDSLMDLRAGRHVELRVSDTGRGMSPEVVSKAFEPFFTTKPKGQGTGLGLATVYGIVRRTDGRIAIESAEGRGTTFVIQLPVTDEEPDDFGSATGAELPVSAGETILLVEDEESVRAVARRILENAGYKVLEASNGRDALDIIEAWDVPIDLLLSDVMMPGMNGIELAERVGALRPAMHRIFMSAYNEPMSLGVISDGVPLIQKPFDRAQLLTSVRELLAG